MPYLWLESLHVAAVVAFVGGLLAAGVLLAVAPETDTLPPRLWRAARAWHRWVTSPAILLVWGLGLTLAIKGGWLPSARWLWVKLALATLLGAIHGSQAATLRRRAAGANPARGAWARAQLPLILVALVGIVTLVVTKPF